MLRRELVQAVPIASLGAWLAPATSYSQDKQASLTPGSFVDFAGWLDAARAASLRFIDKNGADDTAQFMQFLALWVTAMPEVPQPEWQPLDGANARLDAATIAPGRPFVVTALNFAPGCLLPAHCHPGGGGISLCTRGSIAIRHYDLAEGSSEFTETGAIAEVAEVSITLLRENQFTWFTPTDANLHQLEAGPGGATVVDIIVQWSRSGEFSFLRFNNERLNDPRPIGGRRLGSWVGMDISLAYAESA